MDETHGGEAGIVARLASAGLELRETAEGGSPVYVLTGNTYAHKDLIKAHGGRWSQRHQVWAFSELASIHRLAGMLSATRATNGGGLAEAPVTYAPDVAARRQRYAEPDYLRRRRQVRGHRERLRQRFLAGGPDSLKDYELVELLLFHCIDIKDTKPLAVDLREYFGSLGAILKMTEQQLTDFHALQANDDDLRAFLKYKSSPEYQQDLKQNHPRLWSEDGRRWQACELTEAGRVVVTVLTGVAPPFARDDHAWLGAFETPDGERVLALGAKSRAAWTRDDWAWLGALQARADATQPMFEQHLHFIVVAADRLWLRYDETGAGRDQLDRYWWRRQTVVLFNAIQEYLERMLHEQIQERPVIGSWTALLDYLRVALTHEPVEQFRVLFLDRKNALLRDELQQPGRVDHLLAREVQQRGTVDHTPLYPREIVKRALDLGASSLIMVHNHPSGDPTPSRADIEMTKQVVQALAAVGISVHDHVIVGKNRHTSFKSQHLM